MACGSEWLHGHTDDLAAAETAQASMLATDIIGKLPDAFRAVSCR